MGHSNFDQFCVFANRVELSPDQVLLLQSICAESEPTTPLYICSLQMTHVVEGKGKMVSAATSSLLLFFLVSLVGMSTIVT